MQVLSQVEQVGHVAAAFGCAVVGNTSQPFVAQAGRRALGTLKFHRVGFAARIPPPDLGRSWFCTFAPRRCRLDSPSLALGIQQLLRGGVLSCFDLWAGNDPASTRSFWSAGWSVSREVSMNVSESPKIWPISPNLADDGLEMVSPIRPDGDEGGA